MLELFEDVADVEILARLRELGSTRSLNEQEIAAVTRFPLEGTRDALERLSARGLVTTTTDNPARHGYAIADSALRERAEHVVEIYRNDPLKIMNLLTQNAIERVRSAAVVTFAECFRIGGPKSNG